MRHVVFAVTLLFSSLAIAENPAEAPISVEVRFSPHEDTLGLVVGLIHDAKSSILVAAYSFTSKPIAVALVDAKRRGIDVRVVADQKANQASYTATQFLANEGVPVRLNGKYPIHHNKFMVVDGGIVETGSFNYTGAAAEKNAENVLVITGDGNLARQYATEWERLWAEGRYLGATH